ncbi:MULTISPECIES: hypothetical protein [Mycobacterium]|uniref:hypothetical protein n=1 Tax=Mycobacterium TaxID=1763 RepID=UPI001CDA34C6|nr:MULTISPECIES: hypothetical protein [Mycobacterium]MCA2245875.1 hypothetical protein [Mycobacterium sp. WUMAC-067]MCA2317688.1 hypothetical protein [Mycobacterium sp. WUMAC-025]MEE3752596.1 hypothetical protein [Mycobacterium intracellulare]
MPKRSPWERYRQQQRAADAKILDIMLSSKHMCLCGHPQGFHWADDSGENVGECAPADCACKGFDEDVFAEARRRAELATGIGADTRDEAGVDDALARAMRAEEQRQVSAEELWGRVLHADRSRPTSKPRPSTLQNPAALDALRELGGSPEDLAG